MCYHGAIAARVGSISSVRPLSLGSGPTLEWFFCGEVERPMLARIQQATTDVGVDHRPA